MQGCLCLKCLQNISSINEIASYPWEDATFGVFYMTSLFLSYLCSCLFGDFIKLYLHLGDGPHVNNESEHSDVLCGKIADIEQTHYSSGSTLVFEFHSDWRGGNNTGFRGTYRFLRQSMFETDGVLIPNSKCDYNFESLAVQASSIGNTASMSSSPSLPNYSRPPNYSSSSSYLSSMSPSPPTRPPLLNLSLRSNRGRFFSPRYPSTYPRGVKCSYHFIGQNFERIKLVFEHIVLLKSDFRYVFFQVFYSFHVWMMCVSLFVFGARQIFWKKEEVCEWHEIVRMI